MRTIFIIFAFFLISEGNAAAEGKAILSESKVGINAPFGGEEYCRKYPAECGRSAPTAAPLKWLSQIEEVQQRVNGAMRYSAAGPGLYHWTIKTRPASGDCKDYAVTKLHLLAKAGVPRGAMRLAHVLTKGLPHLVLVVRVKREGGLAEDMVLDNLQKEVRPWWELPYLWVKGTKLGDPKKWVLLAIPVPVVRK